MLDFKVSNDNKIKTYAIAIESRRSCEMEFRTRYDPETMIKVHMNILSIKSACYYRRSAI